MIPTFASGDRAYAGHAFGVSLTLDLLANGSTTQELLKEYPELKEEDIRAAIAYGAEMSRERHVILDSQPMK